MNSPSQSDNPASSTPLALYIHVPFCETKCPYCDFNTYARIEPLMKPYVTGVCRELALWGETLGHPAVRTVFFGGGTPSYLGPEALRSIIEAAATAFDLGAVEEVTIECNPGDLTLERAQGLASLPYVDRLSIGVQAFQDHHLALLGRRHTSAEAVRAFGAVREAGFENVNLDFMFGLPGQTLGEWRDTVEKACELRPEHLSLYGLTLEPGTPMEQWVRTGKTPDPDPDLGADQFELARDMLRQAGYEHYEISNWALPGLSSKHNLIYWRNEPYLGVGPGAHSYLEGHRFADIKSPREYIRLVQAWRERGARRQALDAQALLALGPVSEAEAIDQSSEMGETMMMGLRLSEGVSARTFATRFGVDLEDAFGPVIEEMVEFGLLERSGDVIRLTQEGQLLGNEVFQRFLVHDTTQFSHPV
ncbi:MAG: oxygen-independent coproporphyrinogen-3 oxidase [Chloroflexi bacterium]|jgi:oxygen-independent coproporphyrinogen-3 oxidase|nr:MAG: oxygen-independent coproporphyrinogen-3 oxidase [Chloroflexota bacterium]